MLRKPRKLRGVASGIVKAVLATALTIVGIASLTASPVMTAMAATIGAFVLAASVNDIL